MRSMFKFFTVLFLFCASLSAGEFTISSYNCGALSDHYDYIRSVCLHKLMQQRYVEESSEMALLEKIETAALRILFADDPKAEVEWEEGDYNALFERITAHPEAEGSLNHKWRTLSEQIVTTYKERPVTIHDKEVKTLLLEHIKDLTRDEKQILSNEGIDAVRSVMAKRIFAHELKYDVITLQEADYLDASLFPDHYTVLFANTSHSINGVAWNTQRFELIEEIGSVLGRGFVLLLRDLESGKRVLVASGHLSGCNPFRIDDNDSIKGDRELQAILDLLASVDADVKVIGMDSNVTATHPRLKILKDAGFTLDCEKFLEPTCSNPWQVLDTRIDWITALASDSISVSNIPVLHVSLNSYQTNISDHKPIAARIEY